MHDEGTADAQFFSMTLNGTASVVCFKDEESATRCGAALQQRGSAGLQQRGVLLEELLTTIDDEEVEVCLVDEVVETIIDTEADPEASAVVAADEFDEVIGTVGKVGDEWTAQWKRQESSAMPTDARSMLERMYDGNDAAGGGS